MKHQFLVVLAIVFGLSFILNHRALPQAGTKVESEEFESLTFGIATTKSDYLQLEPIPLILTLSNRTERPIAGHSALDFGGGCVEIYVTKSGQPAVKIESLTAVPSLKVIKSRLISPGDQFQKKELLTLELDRIFPEPGSYTIEADLFDVARVHKIRSEPLEIKINAPSGLNYEAFEFIKSYGDPSYFFSGVRLAGNAQKVQTLENFTSVFAASDYNDYASYLLGQVYFAKRDFEKASIHFDRLAKKPGFVFADKASDYLVEINSDK